MTFGCWWWSKRINSLLISSSRSYIPIAEWSMSSVHHIRIYVVCFVFAIIDRISYAVAKRKLRSVRRYIHILFSAPKIAIWSESAVRDTTTTVSTMPKFYRCFTLRCVAQNIFSPSRLNKHESNVLSTQFTKMFYQNFYH